MVTPQEQWYVSTKSVIGLFPVLLHSPEILFIISYFNPVISWWSKDMIILVSIWHVHFLLNPPNELFITYTFRPPTFLVREVLNNVLVLHYIWMYQLSRTLVAKIEKAPLTGGHVTPIQVLLRAMHKEIYKTCRDTDHTEISFRDQLKFEPHPHWSPLGV